MKNMSEAVPADKGKVEIEALVTSSAEEVKGFLEEGEELLKKFHEERLDEEAVKWRLRHVVRLVNILV
jgi:hypothetical protein